MKPKFTLPFILALGMTAGSSAVHAQSLDLDADADVSTDVVTDPLTTNSATSTTTQLCADGEECVEGSAATDSMTTTGEADVDASADADATLPPADADASATADVDANLAPADLAPDVSADSDGSLAAEDEGMAAEGQLTTVAALATPDDLVGARAYDANEDWIGEVSAVLPPEASAVEGEQRVVIDVGGFLGIGEKPVAIPAESLQVSVNAEGEVDHVIVNHSMAELEALPEVEM